MRYSQGGLSNAHGAGTVFRVSRTFLWIEGTIVCGTSGCCYRQGAVPFVRIMVSRKSVNEGRGVPNGLAEAN